MIRQFILFVSLIGLLASPSTAQIDTSHLRVSLLTCGVGDEVWETYGHTAIRVTDSVNGTDNVYNYGTFNAFEEGFELKFMKGKLLYYVSYYPYYLFLREYTEANRSIYEQELILDGKKKENVFDFLRWNAEEEHKYYKYDFLYDNCATRVRDVFPKTFGKYFKFGQTLPPNSQLTFRQIINQYLYRKHFERFGINLLLGSRIDKVMSNEEAMFLPYFLRDGIGNATVKGQKVAVEPVMILDGSPHLPPGINWAFLLTLSIGILTIIGLVIPALKTLGKIMSNLLLFVTGLLGCLMLFMWLGTDHEACRSNYNILWALPTNLVIAFVSKKKKDRYALVAIFLLLVSFLLHIINFQELPLLELSPLLLALLFVYGMIYRSNKLNKMK